MKIFCQLKKQNEFKDEQGVAFLFINNKTRGGIEVPVSKFMDYYEKAKHEIYPENFTSSTPASIGECPTFFSQNIIKRPNFKELINYLIKEMEIDENDYGNELFIESNFGFFLELPWESIKEKIVVFRKVIGGKNIKESFQDNNMMLIISKSAPASNKLKKIDPEIKKIVSSVIETIPKYFKINNIYISKHTTKKRFKILRWSQYNYVHFSMHGDKIGGICLEDENNYNEPDIMENKEIINLLKNKRFSLLFLSYCYSGGGLEKDCSLAFDLINKGIAKYIIGYAYGVGDESAEFFSSHFYNNLVSGDTSNSGIEDVYRKALSTYYNDPSIQSKSTPILYIN